MGTVPYYELLRNGFWNGRHLNTVPPPQPPNCPLKL